MKIGEVSAITGLTERTIRFYMQKELIAPRSEWRNGREYTDFSDADVALLGAVATLRELSFSIEEIRTMQLCPEKIPAVVHARRNAAKAQLELAENAHAVLEKLDGSGAGDIAALAAEARAAAAVRPHMEAPAPKRPEEINQSGMGERCNIVPFEIRDQWNWGAFLMPFWWGLSNRVYQALLTFIPLFGFIYRFYLGSRANELAWKHRYWESVERFRKVQRRWAIVSALITVALLALFIGMEVAEQRQAARLEAAEQAMKEACAASFAALPEWQAFLAGRAEWTDADMRLALEEAGYAPNPSDLFYFEEEPRYRILYRHYFNYSTAGAALSDAGEVVFPDGEEAGSYRVQVEFSDGSMFDITCDADEKGNILSFSALADDAAAKEKQTYIAAVKAAGEKRAVYLAEKTEEVIRHPLFVETFGNDYTFTKGPLPGYENYGGVYEGGELEIGGFYAEVTSKEKLYYVQIRPDDTGKEGELSITEAR